MIGLGSDKNNMTIIVWDRMVRRLQGKTLAGKIFFLLKTIKFETKWNMRHWMKIIGGQWTKKTNFHEMFNLLGSFQSSIGEFEFCVE